jgi:large subunit ribosomal protein L19
MGIIEILEQKNMDLLDPQKTRRTLFDKNSKLCLPPGSVLEVETWDDYPTKTSFQSFSGHMIAVRRRGIDTAFRLRTVIGRVGVEQVYRLFSPNIKAIRVLHRGAARGKPYRRAKLYFTRTPGTRNTLGGVEGVLRKARAAEAEAKAEREMLLKKKGIKTEEPTGKKVPQRKKK